jgi:hypothetical protein
MTLDICWGSGGIIFASNAKIYSQWKVDNCKNRRDVVYDEKYASTLHRS